jgi:hypothetical protein
MSPQFFPTVISAATASQIITSTGTPKAANPKAAHQQAHRSLLLVALASASMFFVLHHRSLYNAVRTYSVGIPTHTSCIQDAEDRSFNKMDDKTTTNTFK